MARFDLLESCGRLVRGHDCGLRSWVDSAVRHLALVLLLLVEGVYLVRRDLLPGADHLRGALRAVLALVLCPSSPVRTV